MKKKISAVFCVLSLMLVLQVPVRAADQDFTLVNATGVTIDELYLSPVSADEWQEDVLGVDVLEDGEEVNITFSRAEDACLWDMLVKDPEGTEVTWEKIDLCKYSRITLHIEDGKVWASCE